MDVCLKKIVVSFFLVVYFAPLTSIGAEKYYTWVDEQGRIQHTVIPEEKNPLIVDNKTKPAKEKAETQEAPSLEALTPDIKAPLPEKVERSASSFPGSEQVPVTSSVEINEDDYIDGDVLEQQGNIRNDDDLPYFTWTDEQGVLRTTPYRPVSKNSQSNRSKQKTKKKEEPLIYTVSDEYFLIDDAVSQKTGNKVDDFAQNLFFKQNDFIHSFAMKCCDDLPKSDPYELDFKNSTYIEISNKTEQYVFSEGKSPFLLIRLPNRSSSYSLELRSFIKNDSRTGVNNAVFYPQLVFLDDKFDVVSILRNPVLEYTAETWYKHGYLKGIFEMDISRGARYLLLNTTRDDLRSKNRIENEGELVINHQKTGAIDIKAIY